MKNLLLKLSTYIILAVLIILLGASFGGNNSKFNTGDYIYFGKYLDKDILWQVVDFDEMNNLVLVSDKILTYKIFDTDPDYSYSSYRPSGCTGAIGPDEEIIVTESGYRNGCNVWSSSDIRLWLNSDKATTYGNELGFLSDKNFSTYEKDMMIPSKHTVLGINEMEDSLLGNTEYEFWWKDTKNIIGNYDNSKYYLEDDLVRLMSLKDSIQWNKTLSIGFLKSPTNEALIQRYDTSTPEGFTEEMLKQYWLDTPTNFFSNSELTIFSPDSSISYAFADDVNIGVVPVITINSSKALIESGKGTIDNPIILLNKKVQGMTSERPEDNIGSYIQFGNYNSAPILWRIIDYSPERGYQLFSEYIICAKSYDSKGPIHKGNDQRENSGSNYWNSSNIRQWLNSSENKIIWTNNPPDSNNTSYNPYDVESGFLSEKNFNITEKNMLMTVSNKTLINQVDINKPHIGSENQFWKYEDSKYILTNPKSAYYTESLDKVYLISYNELNTHIISRGWDFKAIATTEAEKYGTYGRYNTPFSSPWYYYLRDGFEHVFENDTYDNPQVSSSSVLIVSQDSLIKVQSTHMGEIGIKPCLNISYENFKNFHGKGTKNEPFTLKK